jgi:hypothetical protein
MAKKFGGGMKVPRMHNTPSAKATAVGMGGKGMGLGGMRHKPTMGLPAGHGGVAKSPALAFHKSKYGKSDKF